MQFIIMKSNEHEVEEIQKLAKECGVDEVILKTVYLWNDPEMAEKYLPTDKKYSRYLTGDGVKCKTSIRPGCDGLWIGVNINYDGTVVPCCFDFNGSFVLGDVKKQTLQEIWNSRAFSYFRKAHSARNPKLIPICGDCDQIMVKN